ncbi:hypothetical protein Hsc_3630 [Herbaspirillum seropedicae]|nr:hypothetical protein Hsc_3630 [Herbaspirillum seropedicae]
MRQQANANQILLQKALALHQKGQLAPAEELYKKVLVKLPRHFEANYLYGMLKLHQEDWETAEAQLAKAIELNPDHLDTYFDHAGALAHLGRDDEAVARYDLVLTVNADFVEALLARARARAPPGPQPRGAGRSGTRHRAGARQCRRLVPARQRAARQLRLWRRPRKLRTRCRAAPRLHRGLVQPRQYLQGRQPARPGPARL